ncbi:transposase [Methylomicrobium sp. Wu6]|uniref:transposase n=1 Tax=Methylomicrobium sp. Wu6 TaxID=3107928 RepID=UPI002DD63C2A|nr:transposase [Methylomicrobium sp. Wu6]MEC4749734.1 transposase [Methylomicrobium sp. Wu6]
MNCLQGNTKSSPLWIARSKGKDRRINRLYVENEHRRHFLDVPGIGPPTATIVAANIGDGKGYRRSRECGRLKQHNSGNKAVYSGIGKRGNRYIRTLRISGAPAIFAKAEIGAVRFQQRKLTGGRLWQPAF